VTDIHTGVMSKIDILPNRTPLDLTPDSLACSFYKKSPWSITAPEESQHLVAPKEVLGSDDVPIFPSLPPLLRGHPDIHLRNSILRASLLAPTGDPDAEKAFYVADLSVVYGQHQRWKQCLPNIQPFYGNIPESLHSQWRF
jgi:ornithine decarboxylase